MPKKMRTTRNLLLMATLLGSALFARAAEKEMTIGAIYLDTQGYYAGVRQGVQDAAKDSSVQVQLIETNAGRRNSRNHKCGLQSLMQNWSALLPALNIISICYLLTLNTPAVGLPALC